MRDNALPNLRSQRPSLGSSASESGDATCEFIRGPGSRLLAALPPDEVERLLPKLSTNFICTWRRRLRIQRTFGLRPLPDHGDRLFALHHGKRRHSRDAIDGQ